jgi:hypothetical protein
LILDDLIFCGFLSFLLFLTFSADTSFLFGSLYQPSPILVIIAPCFLVTPDTMFCSEIITIFPAIFWDLPHIWKNQIFVVENTIAQLRALSSQNNLKWFQNAAACDRILQQFYCLPRYLSGYIVCFCIETIYPGISMPYTWVTSSSVMLMCL